MDYKLQDPRTIQLSAEVKQLLSTVTTAVDNLNGARPLSPELALRLREALLPLGGHPNPATDGHLKTGHHS